MVRRPAAQISSRSLTDASIPVTENSRASTDSGISRSAEAAVTIISMIFRIFAAQKISAIAAVRDSTRGKRKTPPADRRQKTAAAENPRAGSPSAEGVIGKEGNHHHQIFRENIRIIEGGGDPQIGSDGQELERQPFKHHLIDKTPELQRDIQT